MTAGHNIVDKNAGRATSITATFPNGLTFTADPDEYFVSKIYSDNPATESTEETSTSDYGLIAVDRKKVDQTYPKSNPGGCAFNALLSNHELLRQEVSVHGYKGGETRQTMNTSPLKRVDDVSLYYTKDTAGGVSGGPVFVASKDGITAVGIQVLLEMLGWISDYKLRRSLEVGLPKKGTQSPGVFLQATKGSRPNVIARPIRASLNFILAAVSKKVPETPEGIAFERFVIMGARDPPNQDLPAAPGRPFHLLNVDEGQKSVTLSAVTAAPKKSNVFAVMFAGSVVLSGTQLSLKVQPSNRVKRCDCGCITQDQTVGVELGKGTTFKMS
ncbi:MAG: hypothetical protein M1839_008547 [Geoglossum umbratile]|nr:MAG: hypothetical protein M1839_008547 [Geoglossum umbratile]